MPLFAKGNPCRIRPSPRLLPAHSAAAAPKVKLPPLSQGLSGRRLPPNQSAPPMSATAISIRPEDPHALAARSCLRAYFALLAERIPGIDPTHVPDPDPEAEAFRPPHGAFLIARAGDTVLGCVSLKTVEPGLGEVKRLWVDPAARGQGLARRLMARVEDVARALGFARLVLDTNAALTEAIALYRATGWHDTAPYTGFPATHWFTKPL